MWLALLGPAVAIGFFAGDYAGNVKGDPQAEVFFEVKRTDSGRKVKHFISEDVDFTCTVGTPGETEPMEILATFPVRDRRFKGKGEAVLIGADPFGKVTGRFKRNGVAVGTLLLRGELDGNPGSQCTTGFVEWRAEKTDFSLPGRPASSGARSLDRRSSTPWPLRRS